MDKKYYLLIVIFFAWACKEKMTEEEIYSIGQIACKKSAPFINQLGLNPNTSAFSTTEKRVKGLVLLQFDGEDNHYKIYQDSSWKKFGYLGSIATDNLGNIYTSPIPVVNTLDVPIDSMNKIYKVDASTGKMNVFLHLPKPILTSNSVPFGVLGNYFDCHAKKLYVASVAGSTNNNEAGVIYVIDVASKLIIDSLKGIDAMGLFVGGNTGKKLIYIGKARTSEIVTIELDKEGKFKGKNAQAIFSLDGLGPRGNDRARKIRYDKYGNLIVNGLDFAFNLAAQSETPETVYKFSYDDIEKKWMFNKVVD
jgi:hypothetical protein